MQYVSFEPGETKEITPVAGAITIRKTHWDQDRSVNCEGEGCIHCEAGSKIKISFIVSVAGEDPDLKWEFGPVVHGKLALIPELLVIGTPRPLFVTRTGEGISTRWQVRCSAPTRPPRAASSGPQEAPAATFEQQILRMLKNIDDRLSAVEHKDDPSTLPF